MKNIKRVVSMLVLAVMLASCCSMAFAEQTVCTNGCCNLRTGPGLFYSSIRTVPSGVKLIASGTRTDERGVAWYKVTYKGKTGWVSSVYCSKGSVPTVRQVVIATGNTYIREKANKTSAQLGVLHTGYRATYLKKTSVDARGVLWYKVSYDGVTGWVSSKNTYLG